MIRILKSSTNEEIGRVCNLKGVQKFMKGYCKQNNYQSWEQETLTQLDEDESTVFVKLI